MPVTFTPGKGKGLKRYIQSKGEVSWTVLLKQKSKAESPALRFGRGDLAPTISPCGAMCSAYEISLSFPRRGMG